jgi:ParB-like chromosome segregation protein Spo0J
MKVNSTRQVELAKLTLYERNPRRGDVERIKGSLQDHGQFRAIVVRQADMMVLAGNHSTIAMRELGWRKALAHLIDCSDDEARRIVLVDNRTADAAHYDEGLLRELLTELEGDYTGTGYEEDELQRLLDKATEPSPDPVLIPDSFEIIVSVENEAQQREMLERLTGEGFRCRALL